MNQVSNKKLFIGSLPYSTTDDELRSLFEEIGPVESARVITMKPTGQSKGYGFVEMENAADAQKAIEEMNGKPHNGRTLIVNEAQPERRRERSFGGENRGNGDRGGWGGGYGGAGDRPRRPRRDSY